MTPYSVIIVAHEQPRQLLSSLVALRQHARLSEVLIIDNASSARLDGVVALSQLPARVIRLEQHASLGAALNVGIDAASHDLLLIMHSDVLIGADPQTAVDRVSDMADVGVAGGRLLRPGPHPRQVSHTYYRLGRGRINPELSRLRPADIRDTPMDVDAVPTACTIIRRVDVRFDERFWFRLEDVDLCLQYGQRRLRTIFDSDLVATHQENRRVEPRLCDPLWTERTIASHMLYHERWCSRYDLLEHPYQEAVRGPEASAYLAAVDERLHARCPALLAAC
jgi:GT2 family glycosyltransferase